MKRKRSNFNSSWDKIMRVPNGSPIYENGEHTKGVSSMYVDIGDCEWSCNHCSARFWYGERLKGYTNGRRPMYNKCCSGGKIVLQQQRDPPNYMKELLNNRRFLDNIHAYNQMFAMTSFGAHVEESINNRKENEVANRMRHFGGVDSNGLDPQIVQSLIAFLDQHNELVQIFRTARDKCRAESIPHFKLRRGRLFQQYVVGVYCCIEQDRIDYYRTHQNDIRKDYLSGVYDVIYKGDRVGSDIGGWLIFPKSFIDGPRYIYSHYLNALAICSVLGNPQFFITFTCNVKWTENKRRMEDFPEITTANRADVVVRVFEQKVHDFCNFLRDGNRFGDVTGFLYPAVQILCVHQEHMQSVTFTNRDSLDSIVTDEGKKKTTLTEWLAYIKAHTNGHHLTYVDFPKEFVWYADTKTWSLRKRGGLGSVSRLVYVHPTTCELFYLQLLLCHQKGCTTFADIRTVYKIVSGTFQGACEALGFLGDEKEWHTALEEASISSTPTQLQNLFVQLLIFCEVSDPMRLWNAYWPGMSDDIPRTTSENLHIPNLYINDPELKGFVLDELAQEVNVLKPKLNAGQRQIYKRIIDAAKEDQQALIFVYGHGGTGKTFLWKVLISSLCSKGKIVLAVASSGIASLLLPGNGKIGTPEPDNKENVSWITIPEQYCIPDTHNAMSNMINFIYDEQALRKPNACDLKQKTIVCPRNNIADQINSNILSTVKGTSTIYKSLDEAIPIGNDEGEVDLLYPREYLNTLQLSGFPPHELELNVGAPIMLLRNVNLHGGLYTMTQNCISDLKPGAHNKELEAKVYRKWICRKSSNPAPKDYICILLDTEGNAIQANMGN
nr:DNA helicase [Tanacetum cinerariifolium]